MSASFEIPTPSAHAAATVDPNVVLVDSCADHRIRAKPGDRLHHVIEERVDDLARQGLADKVAVEDRDWVLSYAELDAWSNRLAHHLIGLGVRPGDRLAVLLDRRPLAYVCLLAVSKAGATCVPLDPSFPPDRLDYILGDAAVSLVVTTSDRLDAFCGVTAPLICLDVEATSIAEAPSQRLGRPAPSEPDALCYVIYTSGSSGVPKGVAVDHRSVCNFVRVAAEIYGVRESDRMYQGLTIAFDFSVEEIWVPLAVGATLVPNSTGRSLVGDELADFLRERRVTALCCVPTLLATVSTDIDGLRFLLVSGEACPQDLVNRWYRPDRRFLNVYGPTEASVTATWAELHPDRPVTIGVPLPTYSAVILDPDGLQALPPGAEGELGIAGVCLARGYLNRPEQTARAFVDDFVGMPNNPSGRIYRTGDLACVGPDGQIRYLGRIDTQVKIRGYRIELSEIESVLMQHPQVAQAVVVTHEPAPGQIELAAFVTPASTTGPLDLDDVLAASRGSLPSYMVPAFCDALPTLPMLASNKVDRRALPAPSGKRRVAAPAAFTGSERPSTPTELVCAGALSEVLGIDGFSVDADVFADLGANSLLMARCGALIRSRLGVNDLAMPDLYAQPTVRGLARLLDERAVTTVVDSGAVTAPARRVPVRAAHSARRSVHVGAALFQLIVYLGFLLLAGAAFTAAGDVLDGGKGPLDFYGRAVVVGMCLFAAQASLPIVAKWALIGHWRQRELPIWGLRYLRYWIYRQTLRLSPMRSFAGSPLYNVYLRLLGVSVGRGAVVMTQPPVCTDLVRIGERAVIRTGVNIAGIKAEAGRLRTGPIVVGAGAYVGSGSYLDLHSVLGDGAQLGHASSLQEGQHVAPGAWAAGSPAQPWPTPFAPLSTKHMPSRRRIVLYSAAQLAGVFLFGLPSLIAFAAFSLSLEFLNASAAIMLFVATRMGHFVVNLTVPRLLTRLIREERVYPLFGFHWALSRTIRRTSNSPFFNQLFGDSSYIVGYLRAVGMKLRGVRQTGSNFGLEQRWEVPSLTRVGTGTLISDGLNVVNTEIGSASFRLATTAIGANSFLGNRLIVPPGSTLGDDLLVGTKTMVPTSGPLRTGVGLLGSPAFVIPRSVQRDLDIENITSGPFFDAALSEKNRSNRKTMALYLLIRFLYLYLLTWTVTLAVRHVPAASTAVRFAVGGLVATLLGALFWALIERLTLRFGRLRPRTVSIYDRYYWAHERVWKINEARHNRIFDGTPFKPLAWRLMGVRVGAMLYDPGVNMTERTLVTIGDNCTFNEGVLVQGHSLEDGVFKSDYIQIGDRVTLEPGSFVHYGTVLGPGTSVAPDSFLMKGEQTETESRWMGNPARPCR